jgi:hypothetical protein
MNRQFALFAAAAALAVGLIAGSAAPSAALDLSWVGNKPYVNCLTNAHKVAMTYPPAQRGYWDDRLRRACNRGYYPNRPGVQY